MKTKDEVFNWFQEFKALVENQNGKKIKILRSNNESEYTSNKFEDFCKATGIKKELTVPYNPKQNGVAERKKRGIVGSTKAMIHDHGLPMFLWAKASNTSMYLQNMTPHKALEDMAPKEAFTGVKPKVSHLRIFGSPVYVHIPSKKRTTLEPTLERRIFVGYSETSKAYRIYNPRQENCCWEGC